MNPLSVVMIVFAAVLFIFGALIAAGETGLIRSFHWVRVKDKKEYARFLGKTIAAVGISPLLGALVNQLAGGAAAAVVLAAGIVITLAAASRKSKDYYC